jgi:hypothetical protein
MSQGTYGPCARCHGQYFIDDSSMCMGCRITLANIERSRQTSPAAPNDTDAIAKRLIEEALGA